ncbi:Large ribosomal subunit protein uL10y [Castilleja foliolosa]|uniref:Large ribosomal subunit protein uL10y n=1 Tax=Castilleja foliolosa TaxID=1961234 RepID=A0ABD3CKX6_9LAMI
MTRSFVNCSMSIRRFVLVVAADNVGSTQLQNIRSGLRGDSVVLMGKNTMMKRSIRIHAEDTGNNTILNLIPSSPCCNVGLIFTKSDLKDVSEEVAKYKVGAPARVGLVAPIDVVVPPGNTGLDPSQTSFFQVLNIPTKINKGTVEIITPWTSSRRVKKWAHPKLHCFRNSGSGPSLTVSLSMDLCSTRRSSI